MSTDAKQPTPKYRDELVNSYRFHIETLMELIGQQQDVLKQYSNTVTLLQHQLRVLRETPPAPAQPQFRTGANGGFIFQQPQATPSMFGAAAPAYGQAAIASTAFNNQ